MAHNFKWINDTPLSPTPQASSPQQAQQVSTPLSLKSQIRKQGIYQNTPSGNQYLYICYGDVSKERLDAIISPTDARMSLGGGLSKHLAYVGGPAVTQEVQKVMKQKQTLAPGDAVVTPAGDIDVKYIVHVCGPGPDLRGTPFEMVLMNCVNNALTIASLRNVKSISVPAIGAGANRGDKDLITRIIVDTCLKWFQENPNSTTKHIVFVDTSEEILQLFMKYATPKIR